MLGFMELYFENDVFVSLYYEEVKEGVIGDRLIRKCKEGEVIERKDDKKGIKGFVCLN